MREFWFCSECKSMNQASAKQCYKCRAPQQTATLATVAKRQEGVVLTPGLDDEHRNVAWALMAGQNYISAVAVGYLATALIVLTAIAWVFLATMGIILLVGDEGSIVSTVTDAQVHIFWVSLALFGVSLAATAISHGAFLALMAMDTPALGGGTPRYGMLRSGLWWVESFGWTILAWLILGGPYLGLALFSAPGMVLGVFWLASGWYLMGNPISFLGRPRRLLDDLWARLSVPGSGDARTMTLWSLSWGTARGLVLAYYAFLTLLGVVTFTVLIVAALSGHGVGVTISDNYRTIATLLDALAYGSAFVAETIAYLLLAQVTLGLVDRLNVRERWVKGSAVDPGPAGGQGPDPAFAAPNDPYEYIPPDVRVASQPPASVVQPVPLAGTSFSPQPGKSTPQADQPAGPSIAAPSPGLAAHPVPRSWPAPIQFSDAAPDTGEPPRFDPRAWVPPRPVFAAPQVTAAAPADAVAAPARPGEARKSPRLESVSPAAPALPAEAGWPVELEPRPARDQGPAPADDMGWGEGL